MNHLSIVLVVGTGLRNGPSVAYGEASLPSLNFILKFSCVSRVSRAQYPGF